MSEIKISVMVPAFNSGEFIHICLDSLVAQTLDGIEVVVVNDGSSDNTAEVVGAYVDKYPEMFRLFNKPNSGVADTRNYAVSKAAGKYIGFVDSDDCVEPEFFEKLYNAAEKYDTDIAACNVIEIIGDESNIIYQDRIKQEGAISLSETPEMVKLCRPYLCNKIFKRELFSGDNVFPYGIHYEDVSIIYNILFGADVIALVPDARYTYRRLRSDSVSNSSDEKAFDVFKACDIIYELSQKMPNSENYREVIQWVILVHIMIRIKRAYDDSNKQFKLEFLDKAYEYLDKNQPDWKSNRYYFKNKKNLIFKSKTLTKLVFVYCNFLPVKM